MKVARRFALALLLVVLGPLLPSSKAGAQQDTAETSKGDKATLETTEDGMVTVAIDTVDGGNGSTVTWGDVANSDDACVGPSAAEYSYGKEEEKTELRPTGKRDKNGKPLLASVYIRTEQRVVISCNGAILRTFMRCVKDCPPFTPQPDSERIILAQIGREKLKLQKPKMSLWPKPSEKVPLPGVSFFYGVDRPQFNTIQPLYLTACGGNDCVSVFVKAKPDAVYFDPGDGTGKRTSCKTDGPAVVNKRQAVAAGDSCMVRYRRAGKFNATLYLHYRVDWSFYQWTRTDAPLVRAGVRFATTSRPFLMTVHERQPVVIG